MGPLVAFDPLINKNTCEDDVYVGMCLHAGGEGCSAAGWERILY